MSVSVDTETMEDVRTNTKKPQFRPSPVGSSDSDSCHSYHTTVSVHNDPSCSIQQNGSSSVSSTSSANSSGDLSLSHEKNKLTEDSVGSSCDRLSLLAQNSMQSDSCDESTNDTQQVSEFVGPIHRSSISEKNSPNSSKATTDSPLSTEPRSMASNRSDSHGNPEGRFPEISNMLELTDDFSSVNENKSKSIIHEDPDADSDKTTLENTIDYVLEKIRTGRGMDVKFDPSLRERPISPVAELQLSQHEQTNLLQHSSPNRESEPSVSSHQKSSVYLTQRQRIQTALDQAASSYYGMQQMGGSQTYMNKMHNKGMTCHSNNYPPNLPRGYLPHQYVHPQNRMPHSQSSMYMHPYPSSGMSMQPRQHYPHSSMYSSPSYSSIPGRSHYVPSNSYHPYPQHGSSIPPHMPLSHRPMHPYMRPSLNNNSLQHRQPYSQYLGPLQLQPPYSQIDRHMIPNQQCFMPQTTCNKSLGYSGSLRHSPNDSSETYISKMPSASTSFKGDHSSNACLSSTFLRHQLSMNTNKSQLMPPPNNMSLPSNAKKRKMTAGHLHENKRRKSVKLTPQETNEQHLLVKQRYFEDALRRICSVNFQQLIHEPLVTPSLAALPPKGGEVLRNILNGYEAEVDSENKLKKPTKYSLLPYTLKYPKPDGTNPKDVDNYIVQQLPSIKFPQNLLQNVPESDNYGLSTAPDNPISRTPEPQPLDISQPFSVLGILSTTDEIELNRTTPPLPCPYPVLLSSCKQLNYNEIFGKEFDNPQTLITDILKECSSPTVNFMPIERTFSGTTDKTFIENAVTVSSLIISSKHLSCKFCEMPIIESQCIPKRDIHLPSNKPKSADSDTVFCSVNCLTQFSKRSGDSALFDRNINDDPHKLFPTSMEGQVVKRRQLVGRPPTKKRSLEMAGLRHVPIKKRWRGIRWKSYLPVIRPIQFHRDTVDTNLKSLTLGSTLQSLPDTEVTDNRYCILCKRYSDGPEHTEGRLLNLDVDSWIHLNCVLWCYDVYETVSGCLMEVAQSVKKALKTLCVFCGHYGAGIVCYRSRCPAAYHIPCAQAANCMFFTDRGMYCSAHRIKDHPLHLPQLNVERRVYIGRDESEQVASVVLDAKKSFLLRIGSIILHHVGQLLPEQLASGDFHTENCIYPVGFKTTRFFWSSVHLNKRCRYECSIEEYRGKTQFVVSVQEPGQEVESYKSYSCTSAWKVFLDRIDEKRRSAGLIKLFPKHIRGEDLFGLTEPHIVRAIESLPGVEFLKNYVFKFGRMQLITEMPLAVNPTGCARSEPKLRTYVRRSHGSVQSAMRGGTVSAEALESGSSFGAPSLVSGISNHENIFRLVSSKTQQYRRLRTDWKNNVSLGRSRIQGLGLFAARDMEKLTLVIEYLGETIRNEVGNRRERQYEAQNRGVYMFRTDEENIVDATICGGLARYVNHCCEPNCSAEIVQFDGSSHIIILTNKRVEKGEELTYDYNFDFEDCSNKIPCHCGAPTCRKWMN